MRVRLGDCIEQIRGVSYSPTDLHSSLNENSVILLRANNIKDNKINFDDVVFIDKSKVSNNQYLQEGDILVCASSGSKQLVGKAAYVDKSIPVTFGAFCKIVRPVINFKRYIGYFFESNVYRTRISELSSGVNINNIKNEHIDNLEFDLPEISCQNSICIKLNLLSLLIEKRKQQLEKLDLLIKSQFIAMFGNYDLRSVKPNWVKIGEVADVVGGSTPKTDKAEFWGGEYSWITPAEISDDSFVITKTVRTLTKAGVKSCSLRLLPINTVILSSRAPIGKVAIAGVEMYCNQGFKNLICSEKMNAVYAYCVLKFNADYLNALGRGATFKEISKAIVDNISIPLPSIERQEQFATFVEQTEKSKSTIKHSLDKLTTLKNALMQKYFG